MSEKPFYNFERYLTEHEQELKYDSVFLIRGKIHFPELGENPQLAREISAISYNTTLALLRAYHNWTQEQQETDVLRPESHE